MLVETLSVLDNGVARLPTVSELRTFWIGKLSDFRSEAASQGSKASSIYFKAITSLKNSSIEFTHTSQLTQLPFIGKGIAERLEAETVKLCKEQGWILPDKPAPSAKQTAARKQREDESQQSQSRTTSASKRSSTGGSTTTTAVTTSKGKARAREPSDQDSNAEVTLSRPAKKRAVERTAAKKRKQKQFLSDSSSESDNGQPPQRGVRAASEEKEPAKRKKKPPKEKPSPKDFVPQQRSGGHGIMLALWSVTADGEHNVIDGPSCSRYAEPVEEDGEAYLRKSEIIDIGQQWCDSDYIATNQGSSSAGGSRLRAADARYPSTSTGGSATSGAAAFFTPWSSMKTLIKHGYVYQTGVPPKFCLSDEGIRIAKGIAGIAKLRKPEPPAAGTDAELVTNDGDRGAGRGSLQQRQPQRAPANEVRAEPTPSKETGAETGRRARLVLPPKVTTRAPETIDLLGESPVPVRRRVSPPLAVPVRMRLSPPAPARKRATPPLATPQPPAAVQPFLYVYVSRVSRHVIARSQAAVRLSDADYSTTYAIQFPSGLRDHKIVEMGAVEKVGPVDVDNEGGEGQGMLRGWIREDAGNEVAPGLGSEPVRKRLAPAPTVVAASQDQDAVSLLSSEDEGDVGDLRDARKVYNIDSDSSQLDDLNVQRPSQADSESQGIMLEARGPYRGLYGESQVESASERESDHRPARRPRLSGIVPPPAIGISWHNAILPAAALTATAGPSTVGRGGSVAALAAANGFHPPTFEPIIMPAGSFTIHLLIDTREIRSRGQQTARPNDFSESLQLLGVPAETRALPLGDAVWIARRKDGGRGDEDEVVLDFIVERKRLDDLSNSIRDGRWSEQKFRLASSGISHVVYIIEDFQVDQQWGQFGEGIQTALSSTQIVDGYFVERTANIEHTLRHFSLMHDIVRERWEKADLYVLPSKVIERHTYLELQTYLRRTQPHLTHLTSYASFAGLSNKSASLTLRDIWARMLLCIRGLSAEKAAEILDRWPTPSALYDALIGVERLPETSAPTKGPAKGMHAGQRMLFETIQPPEQRRTINAALSAKIWDTIMLKQYPAAARD